MATEAPMIKVVDHCRVSPEKSRPISSPKSLTLSPFDIPWHFLLDDANQSQRIFFYEISNSNDFIHQHLLPSLKTSLSLALKDFYPYASKLVFPPFPEKPRIVFTDGDSVPFTVAESMMDFGELVGDQVKDVKLFHPLIPKFSPQMESEDDGTWIIPDLLSIQVTVFPNSGLCIGIHYNHTVGDGASFMYFLKSWASICRTESAETSLVRPFLDREVEGVNSGVQTIQLLKEWSQTFPRGPNHKSPLPSYAQLRATFILSKTNLKRLKEWITLNHQQRCPTLSNISSFAAACAFTWVCLVKSKQLYGEVIKLGDIVQPWEFGFVADVRSRLTTPTPETYFGNCLVVCHVRINEKVLLGQHGIVFAAEAISEKVRELNEDGVAERALETMLSNVKACRFERLLTVAGSSRQAVYETDFGWGRPKKCEMVHIDATGAISLAERRDEEGGLEIGVALEREAIDKFATLFHSFI